MKPARPPVLLLLLLPSLALAQTAALGARDDSRGATLPPTSAALVDEATSSLVNPAGLLYEGGFELDYLHERSVSRAQTLDGVYLGDTFLGAVGLGLSLEWMRTSPTNSYRKTSWTFALGGPQLSLGGALNIFSGASNPDLKGMTSFDLGLSGRPTRGFSFGASIKNVDEPARGAETLPRKYDLGLGFRPFHERLTLGVDYLFSHPAGFDHGVAQLTAQGEVFHGVALSAGIARGFRSGDDLLFQVALALNLEHVGVTYAGGAGAGGLDHVLQVRISHASYPALEVGPKKVAYLDLATELQTANTALTLLGATSDDPYLSLTRLLERAQRDPELAGVLLKVDSLPATGLGKAEELRQSVLRLRAAGKKVIAVLLSGGDTEYYVASAADQIYAVPQALLLINGFEAELSFAGEAMQKLGVHWDVAKVGKYKNAPDQLVRSSATAEQKEAVNALLDTDVRQDEAAVVGARHLDVQRFREALAEGILSPNRAQELGLVDGVLDTKGLEEKLGKLIPGAQFDEGYFPPPQTRRPWGVRRRIAIVPVLGDISGGKSREDPFGLTRIAGADTIVRALREAEEDASVAAIVLRVDSSGGDGLASDLIYRAVLHAREKKPVVASMGDVAASGGYYAAVGADEVFASPTTITGSIGVFVVKPAVEELAQKLGLRQEPILRAPSADIFSFYRPWTPAEQRAAQQWVDAFYDDFISEVARCRKLPKPSVDAVARGRVWSGEDAKAHGLVDTLGGLHEALESARARAHVSADEDLELAVYGNPHGLFSSLGGEGGVLSRLHLDGSELTLPEGTQRLARALGLPSFTLVEPGLKAMQPYGIHIR